MTLTSPCADSIRVALLDDPAAPVDAACVDELPPISFVGAS
ncbi:MAG: hypothetical protein AAGA42_08200 [Actinomycetota bacterium]